MKYFIYCRKSSEDKHRQVLSIQSQQREAERAFFGRPDIEIVGAFEEERSAMKPGRPVFADMVHRIERGDAQGIVAWSPDRLARNSIDGGHLIYLLDCGILQDLKFSTYTFENNSQGKFMLQIMFGQSKYYSDALSENVRRGIRTKIENGWWPASAPLGYRNDRNTGTIVADPERFILIEKMLRMMLSGGYSAEQVWQASRSWGLRTPVRRKIGGKYLALSTVYKILYSPFYAGIIAWNEKWYPGKHPAMITLDEHERITAMLRSPGRSKPKTHYFAYTGLLKCGSCGLSVTAENKINRFGSKYVYYHCTKRLRPRCNEPSIEVAQLEAQIRAVLQRIYVPDELYSWTINVLRKDQRLFDEVSSKRAAMVAKAIAVAERRSFELADMRSRRLISDAEFTLMREDNERDLLRLRQSANDRAAREGSWFEPSCVVISFCNQALSWFDDGTDEEKRLILVAIGSNPVLRRRILSIDAREPFRHVPRIAKIPNLRAFVKNIRKMQRGSALTTVMSALTTLNELRTIRSRKENSTLSVPASRRA